MGRVITPARRAEITAARLADPEAIGPILGELVIEGNIPVEGVAQLLQVSEPTVYRWMYGHAAPRDALITARLKKFLTILRKSKRAKDTPLTGNMASRMTDLASLIIKHKPPVSS
jgi:hypothetical protein